MVRSESYNVVMRRLMRYANNVNGTNAFWHNGKEKLKAIISQISVPTIFWSPTENFPFVKQTVLRIKK